jgi:hypothetical protein
MTAVRHVALLLTLAATLSAHADNPPKAGPAQYQPAGQIAGKLASISPDKAGGTVTLKLPELSMKSRPSRRRLPQATVVQKDHEYDLADDVKVRFRDLPKGPDGKAKHYTNDEYQQMREPIGTPGYRAAMSDLKPGQAVRLYLGKANPKDKPVVTVIMILADGAAPAPAGKGDKPKP